MRWCTSTSAGREDQLDPLAQGTISLILSLDSQQEDSSFALTLLWPLYFRRFDAFSNT